MSRELNIKKQLHQSAAADSLKAPSKAAPLKAPVQPGGEEPKLFYEDGWNDMDQRVLPDTLQESPAANKQQDALPVELPGDTLEISASVGKGGVNTPEDTEKIRMKMEELGLLQPGGDLVRAITEFQSYIMKSGVPDGRVDAGGYTLRMLQQADAAGVELLRKEKQQRDEEKRKAEEKAKKDAELKAQADKNKEKLNAQKKAETISKAGELIKKHTNMGGLNLNEEGLGSELAGLALTDPAVILAVLQQLEWEDRDDVSSAIVDKLGKKLAQLDRIVLRRLLHELDEGMTTSTEEHQMRLIKIVLGVEEKEGEEKKNDMPKEYDPNWPLPKKWKNEDGQEVERKDTPDGKFYEQRTTHRHMGVDLNMGSGSADLGAPIYATHDGTVKKVDGYDEEPYNPAGNRILILSLDKTYETAYFHLLEKPNFKVGDKVKEGQIVGRLGGTGKNKKDAYKPHLHYEIHKVDKSGKSTAVDPFGPDEKILKPGDAVKK